MPDPPRLVAMGDLFDEFMRELERRRAEAEGRTPPHDPNDDASGAGGKDAGDRDRRASAAPDDEAAPRRATP